MKTKKKDINSRKKYGLFNSEIYEIKKASEPLYKIPKRTQDLIPIRKISKSGIFQIDENKFSKTYRFTDINYECEPDEEQYSLMEKYKSLLDCIGTEYKIMMLSKKRNMEEFRKSVFFQYCDDGNDALRDCFNTEMENIIESGGQGMELLMYLTITITRSDFEEAKAFFITIESTLSKKFEAMGSELLPLSVNERLELIKNLNQMDDEYELPVEINNYIENFGDFVNDICCTAFKYESPSMFQINGRKYGQILYISRYGNKVSDRFINKICHLGIHSIATFDFIPIEREIAKKYVENKLIGVENDIDKQQKKRNENLAFASDISRLKRKEKESIEKILDCIDEGDMNLYFVGATIVLIGDTKEEVMRKSESLRRLAKEEGCRMDIYTWKLQEALITAMPYGIRQVSNTRLMVTASASAIFPFTVQELCDMGKHSLFYGKNMVSKNIIFANRKKLENGIAFVFGKTGFGKSVFLKMESMQVYLKTADDIIILDPALECKDIVRNNMKGEYMEFSYTSQNHINPLKVDLKDLDLADLNGNIAKKVIFMEGFCEKALCKTSLDPITYSVIDDALKNAYFMQIKEKKEEITLEDFLEQVKAINRPQAEGLFYALKRYTTGALSMFNHKQNVNTNNRVTAYGIRDIDNSLWSMAMMIILMNIRDKVIENFTKYNKATWIYVDEFHNFLNSEYTEQFFFKIIMEIRKNGGLVCCSTQNIVHMLQSYKARTMIDNSEFVLMLKQAAGEIPELIDTISGMKETYGDYLLNASAGEGIMKFGNNIFPVSMEIDKKGSLYNLVNTNMHEKNGSI